MTDKQITQTDNQLRDLGLNSQEILFIYHFCSSSINFVGVQAALATMGFKDGKYTDADYNRALKFAGDMMKSINVKQGIDILRRQRLRDMEEIAQDAVKEIHTMAITNPTKVIQDGFVESLEDLPDEIHSCIKESHPVYTQVGTGDVDDDGKEIMETVLKGYKLTFYDKTKALSMLVDILGLKQVQVKHDVSDNFAELLKEIKNKKPDIVVKEEE